MKKLLLAVIFFCSINIYAQSPDSVIEKRISRLEKILSYLPRISGMLDFRYQYSSETSTFDIRRARLDFQGEISKYFDYRLQLELTANPCILDAYARVKIRPYFNIQGGAFKIPFSLENPYSPKNLEFIDNAMSIIHLSSYQDLSGIRSNGRDIGIMIYGGFFRKKGFNILEYSLGIFNGAGINVRDNNKSKDIVGRLNISPIKSITLSASGYLGQMVVDDDHKYERRDRYGFGFRFDNKKFIFRTEFLTGLTAGLRSSGGYAVAGYTFIDKITPAIRFDIFQNDIHRMDTRRINYAVGLSYWINKYFRCQVNYTYQTFFEKENNGSLIMAMVTATF